VQELAWTEASSRVGELERPQEVGSLLEVGPDSEDLDSVSIYSLSSAIDETYLVDQVFHADDAVLAKVLLDDGVVSQGNTLLVAVSGVSSCHANIERMGSHLAISTLVD
jgi:hypothetical protein